MKEAALLNVLRHPSIISYYEAFIESDVLHIVMEYAERGDLQRAIRAQKKKNRHFAERQVLLWTCQLAMAVDHMHAKKVLHRDLKTANVFLLRSGVAKIGDFGIARVLEKTCGQAETQIGTPYFLSPEAVSAQPYGSASDIWGLGCVVYEICALQRVFNASSLLALVYKIVNEPVPAIPPVYSAELRELVASMLCKSAADRPSAADILATPLMQATLRSLAGDEEGQAEDGHLEGGATPGEGTGGVVPVAADPAAGNQAAAATGPETAASVPVASSGDAAAVSQGGGAASDTAPEQGPLGTSGTQLKDGSLRGGTVFVPVGADPAAAMAAASTPADEADDDASEDEYDDDDFEELGDEDDPGSGPAAAEAPLRPLETPRPAAARAPQTGLGAAAELKSPGARATRQRELLRRDDAIGAELRALAAAELDRPSPADGAGSSSGDGQAVGFAPDGGGGGHDASLPLGPPGGELAREGSAGAASVASVDSCAGPAARAGEGTAAAVDLHTPQEGGAPASEGKPRAASPSAALSPAGGAAARPPPVDRPIQAAQPLQERVRRQRAELLESLGAAVFEALYAKLLPVAEGRVRPSRAWQEEAVACVPGRSARQQRAVVMNMESLLYDEGRAKQAEQAAAAASARAVAVSAPTAAAAGSRLSPTRSPVRPLKKGGGRTMLGSNAALHDKTVAAAALLPGAVAKPRQATPGRSRLVREVAAETAETAAAAAAGEEDDYGVDDEFDTPPSAIAAAAGDGARTPADRLATEAELAVLGSTGVIAEAHSEPASARGPISSLTMGRVATADGVAGGSWHGSSRVPTASGRRPSTSGERAADRPSSAARPGSASRKRVHVVRGALPAAGSGRARPQSRDIGSAGNRRSRRGSAEFALGRA